VEPAAGVLGPGVASLALSPAEWLPLGGLDRRTPRWGCRKGRLLRRQLRDHSPLKPLPDPLTSLRRTHAAQAGLGPWLSRPQRRPTEPATGLFLGYEESDPVGTLGTPAPVLPPLPGERPVGWISWFGHRLGGLLRLHHVHEGWLRCLRAARAAARLITLLGVPIPTSLGPGLVGPWAGWGVASHCLT
jgi:hypothetical protein